MKQVLTFLLVSCLGLNLWAMELQVEVKKDKDVEELAWLVKTFPPEWSYADLSLEHRRVMYAFASIVEDKKLFVQRLPALQALVDAHYFAANVNNHGLARVIKYYALRGNEVCAWWYLRNQAHKLKNATLEEHEWNDIFSIMFFSLVIIKANIDCCELLDTDEISTMFDPYVAYRDAYWYRFYQGILKSGFSFDTVAAKLVTLFYDASKYKYETNIRSLSLPCSVCAVYTGCMPRKVSGYKIWYNQLPEKTANAQTIAQVTDFIVKTRIASFKDTWQQFSSNVKTWEQFFNFRPLRLREIDTSVVQETKK